MTCVALLQLQVFHVGVEQRSVAGRLRLLGGMRRWNITLIGNGPPGKTVRDKDPCDSRQNPRGEQRFADQFGVGVRDLPIQPEKADVRFLHAVAAIGI